MNHEVICKFCKKDQRLHGLNCCKKFMEEEDRMLEEEYQKKVQLKDILFKHNILAGTIMGGILIPDYEIKKLSNLLKRIGK
jgi:hypothetical protein